MNFKSFSFCLLTAALPWSVCVTTARAADTTQAQDRKPAHEYVYEDHGIFGYRRALSAVDRANGIAAPSLTLVRMKSRQGGYTFFSQDDAGNQVSMQCNEPCAAMRVGTMAPTGAYREQVIPVDAGTILAAVLHDARLGYLDSGIQRAAAQRAPAGPASTPLEDLKAKLRQNHEDTGQK